MEVGRSHETPAGARPWRPGSSLSRLAAAAAAGVLLLSGCAISAGDDTTAGGEGAPSPLPRELAEEPAPLRPLELAEVEPLSIVPPKKSPKDRDGRRGEGAARDGAGGASGGRDSDGGDGGATEDGDGGSSKPPASTTLASRQDPRADAGDGPGYADLRALTLSGTGRTAVVTVDLDGRIPRTLREGEVMGIGVDLYRDAGGESDYQLFADGSSEGWFAYLHTPDGFVDYPGEFRLGEQRMVFEVDWDDLGGISDGSVASFADWSQRREATNDAGADVAPDDGPEPFTR